MRNIHTSGGTMIFEYNGFSIHQTGIQQFYVIEYSFNGWFQSVIEAVNFIDGLVANQCDF
jgi:hypothetical protein